MKSYLIVLLAWLFWMGQPAFAHEGHNEAPAASVTTGTDRKAEAVSDKYEYVLKFAPDEVGKTVSYRLYLNEFLTNRPVRPTSIKLRWGKEEIKPTAAQPGVFVFEHTVEPTTATLKVQLNAPLGPDLVALTGIDAIADDKIPPGSGLSTQGWPFLLAAMALGAFIMYLVMRVRRPRLAALLIAGGALFPLGSGEVVIAHEGHDKPAKTPRAMIGSGLMMVAQETQFLFTMETERIVPGQFAPSVKVFGTIAPAPQGQAVVSSPFTGTIRSLLASVGARVKRGQVLATVEQVVDAQTRTTLTAERNTLEAELAVARLEYERLQTVADIASKRDLSEAQSRFDRARRNLAVYRGTLTGGARGSRSIQLRSPIDGVVQNFNYAVGATLEAGATAFTVTNLDKVYAEAQVFDKDLPLFAAADSFSVTCADPARRHVTAQVRLVSLGQSLNATNQSQRVLFEVVNADEDFKLGEFVDVRAFSRPVQGTLSVPTAAITEVDGKPVLFVKTAPELFRLVYIKTGQASGDRTVVASGLTGDERVLATSAYQARMIYANQ